MSRIIILTMRYVLITCLLLLPFSAQAVKIRNLDEVSHQVTVINGGERYDATIEPGMFYYSPGPSIVIEKEGQNPIRARNRQEYIIYKGKVILQRHYDRDGRR